MVTLLAYYVATGVTAAVMGYLALGLRDVQPGERGVVLRFGRLQRIAGPGQTWILPGVDRLIRVGMSPFRLLIEIPVATSREGAWHSATLSAECSILQPERVVGATPDHIEATRSLLEAAFRQAAGEMDANELLAERSRLGKGLKKLANEQALSWGVDIQAVDIERLEGLRAPGPGEEARWEVVLVATGERKITLLKRVREVTGLGLKEAKELIESAPVPVARGLTLQAAEGLRARLLTTGATVNLALKVVGAGGAPLEP